MKLFMTYMYRVFLRAHLEFCKSRGQKQRFLLFCGYSALVTAVVANQESHTWSHKQQLNFSEYCICLTISCTKCYCCFQHWQDLLENMTV